MKKDTVATTEAEVNTDTEKPTKKKGGKKVKVATSEVYGTPEVGKTSKVILPEPDPNYYPTFEPNAWRWVWTAMKGAPSPILFLGMNVPDEIAGILGRSITLEEAQCLVQVDGPVTKCSVTKEKFQPIKYLPFTPPSLQHQLKKRTLTEVRLPYGGQYYTKKDGSVLPVSGSRYKYEKARHAGEDDRYVPFFNGALQKVSRALAKKLGQKEPVWPVTYDQATGKLRVREKNDKNDKTINALLGDIDAPRRKSGRRDWCPGAQVRDAFSKSKKSKGSKKHRVTQDEES